MEPMDVGLMLGVGDDPKESIAKLTRVGVNNAQMGVPPDDYLSGDAYVELKQQLEQAGIEITIVFCGFAGESYADIPTVQRTVGYVPQEPREARIEKSLRIADFAKKLGVPRIAAHVGFIPEDVSDPLHDEMVGVIQRIADYCDTLGLGFSLETGQETGEALLSFLKAVDRANVAVNFDPANMILYGSGEPIAALKLLKDYVASVHCKDGTWPTEEGQLGTETPLGEGDVGIDRFIATLKEIGYQGPLTIEREISGEKQVQDMIEAKELLESLRDR